MTTKQHPEKKIQRSLHRGESNQEPGIQAETDDSLSKQARLAPETLSAVDMASLQGTIGNQAVGRILSASTRPVIQREEEDQTG